MKRLLSVLIASILLASCSPKVMITSSDNQNIIPVIDSVLFNDGCAAIHFYRPSGMGALIGYSVRDGEKDLFVSRNNTKTSAIVKATGIMLLSATTESTTRLEIDLKPGYHYYVRCTVKMGAFIGRPNIELVENVQGKIGFDKTKDR